MRCNKCGFEITNNDKFCSNCGEVINLNFEENIKELLTNLDLKDGNIKIKHEVFPMIIVFIFLLCLFACVIWLGYGLIHKDFEAIIGGALGIFGFSYIVLITPYLQNSNNYSVRFKSKNSFKDFEMYYKNKLIVFKYKVGNDGKFAFVNNDSKLSCVEYADGSKMNNMTKYRIVNYFSLWLKNNNLLSEEVTQSFEEL